METSLTLIAELLEKQGTAAHITGCGDVRISKIRMLPEALSADLSLEPDALYVAAALPEGPLPKTLSALALPIEPTDSCPTPCLVVDGVESAIELANAIASARDSLAATLSRMNDLTWQPGGLSQIITELTSLAGNPAYVVDSGFKVMAIADEPDMEEASLNWMHAARYGYLSYDTVASLIQSNELAEIESHEGAHIVHSAYFLAPFANYNLRHEGKVQGHLFVVQMYKVMTPGEVEIVDLFAPYVLHAMLADPAFQARSGPLYEHFVNDWLDGAINDRSYIRRQLRAMSYDPDGRIMVAVMWLGLGDRAGQDRLAWILEDRQGCSVVSRPDRLVAIFQLKDPTEKGALLRRIRQICHNQGCRATVSDVQESAMLAPRAYRQACETRRIAEAVRHDGDVMSYGDVAAYQPYLNFESVEELEAFCHPAIITLRDYDETHAVQLLPTLSAYLKSNRDVQSAAAELFIHRNTLTYRINKILELCPVDLDDFTTRHRLLESILVVENLAGIAAYLQSRNG